MNMKDDTVPIPVIVKHDSANNNYYNANSNDQYSNHNFRQSAYDPSNNRNNYYNNEYNHNYGKSNSHFIRNIGVAAAAFVGLMFSWLLINSISESGSTGVVNDTPTHTITTTPTPTAVQSEKNDSKQSAEPILPSNIPTNANELGKTAAKGANNLKKDVGDFLNGFQEQMKHNN